MAKIVLLGMMASGKTTLGKIVTEQLDIPFIDTDEELERRAGMKVSEIFRRHGEKEFRRLEREIVDELLARPGSLMLALGGGAFMQDDVRATLRNRAMSVYLRVKPEELVKRLEQTDLAARPLLCSSQDWRRCATEITAERDPVYMDADIIFPADGHDVGAMGERLVCVLTRMCRMSFDTGRLETAHA